MQSTLSVKRIVKVANIDANGTFMGSDATNPGETPKSAAMETVCRGTVVTCEGNKKTLYDRVKSCGGPDFKSKLSDALDLFPERKPIFEKLIEVYSRPEPLFDSFLALLDAAATNPELKIVVRTFGKDGPLIKERIALRHPQMIFHDLVCSRKPSGRPFFQTVKLGIEIDLSELISQSSHNEHFFVQDDYAYWNAHGRSDEAGKYVPGARLTHEIKVVHVGLDDNPCMYSFGEEPATIHRVVTEDAALDPSYFLNLLGI